MKKQANPSAQGYKPAALAPRRRKPPSHDAGARVPAILDEASRLADLRELIQSARQRIVTMANSTATLLYWHLRRRLLAESLPDERAPYGRRILVTLSRQLTVEFGQALVLRWLDKHERTASEEAPIGLILCADAGAEQVELLELDAKSIRVGKYVTELPPTWLLRQRLHQAIEHTRDGTARRLSGEGRPS